MKLFKKLRNARAYRKILKEEDIYRVSDHDFDSYKDGGSISAEMALGLVRGDPKVIKKYEEQMAKEALITITGKRG